jgi:hypothetical protein
MENQPTASELKKTVGGQYSDMNGVGDSSQVSEHYQYCFRNAPYDDSNQQYRKTGNEVSMFIHFSNGRNAKVLCSHFESRLGYQLF